MLISYKTIIIKFLINLAITALLLTIDWFTWEAWLCVSILLTWKRLIEMRRELIIHTMYDSWIEIIQKIIEHYDTRLSIHNANWRN